MTDKKRVLILCTGNSARSQMAEGLLRHDAGDRFDAESAGTRPTEIRPEAIAAMREAGIDISGHRSKSVDEFAGQNFDYVITVCDKANETCPVFSGQAIRIHHNFEDPAASLGTGTETMAVFRRVRDEIRGYLKTFAAPSLREQFGEIDIYLFDQILRGRIAPGTRIVDAGCGSGRNLVYFLRQGYEAFGADSDPQAVAHTRRLARALAPALPADNFRVEPVERMSFPAESAGLVISSAVLHFAAGDDRFRAMLWGTWKMLKPGGLFFCRLASSIGMEDRVQRVSGRRFLLPDGSERYLVDEALLLSLTKELGGELADPLKTSVVQNMRCMTTWVIRKNVWRETPLRTGIEFESTSELLDRLDGPATR